MQNYSQDNFLTLSLSFNAQPAEITQPMVPYTTSTNVNTDNNNNSNNFAHVEVADDDVVQPPILPRPRRIPRQRRQKSETIPPPFPWATDRRAKVHTLKYLLENGIRTVSGSVECKRCKTKFEMELNIENKFAQVWEFIQRKDMLDRAPDEWEFPVLQTCEHCGHENSVQPNFAGTKKRAINWLFLFLVQMIGCCTIKKIKYFLKHNKIHRTGAKNRIIYLTYIGMCKLLAPEFFR